MNYIALFRLICVLLFAHTFTSGMEKLRKWDSEEFKDSCIAFHNFLRVVHNSPPIKWDHNLEEKSKAWAGQLTILQTLEHPPAGKYGSNIYSTGTINDIDLLCLEAVAVWYKEISDYDFSNPTYSKETGHFTQMIWRDSEKLGMGEEGQTGQNFYAVAEYDPPGNVDGGYEDNVQIARKQPTSCISKIGKHHYFDMLKDELKKHKIKILFEESDKPCVIPTKNHTKVSTHTNKGETGVPGGSLVGSTGTKESQTTNPNENLILVDTVSEPGVPSNQNPEVVIGQPNQFPQTNPNLVFLPHVLSFPQNIQPTEAAKPALEVESRPLASINSSSVNSMTSLNGSSIN
ncbi:scoloptoxin SSD552-like [Xenia sp. Carnegie-2017]|uniref:scoloptoxin SSD552-like n=1 Tax=Xenia sp. Carnegie-2017 TaxID=2897299 RepID=UPI001F037C1E|nr:scoloptoxin SSD552-like [Xenia sp. Carnegie-2017]